MNQIALRVEHLGKAYRITHLAHQSRRYRTLRDDLVQFPRRLWQTLRGQQESEETLWALRDVSLDVREGEVLGIIGRNGAGKSTLLKILSRITDPTTGRAEVFGRVGSLLEVGTGFHAELTGRENIYLSGAILGMRRGEIDRKFDEIVAFAEMDRFIDTPAKRYSSGMYMRLAFAVAAHLEPEILVVDEVLAVGDAEFQKKCLGRMQQVGQSGRTVLFVSHNMNAVEQLCSRAILLHQGMVGSDSTDVRHVIKEHLFGGGVEVHGAAWRQEGTQLDSPWFGPRSFSVVDANGLPHPMPVPNHAPMWLQVDGVVEQTDPAFNLGYAVYSEEGHLLYWSFSTDETPERWPSIERGALSLRVPIPPRLLNEGVYRIELLASLHCRKWLLEPGVNAPSSFLRIQGGLSDSPLWTFRRPGMFAPVLQWNRVRHP